MFHCLQTSWHFQNFFVNGKQPYNTQRNIGEIRCCQSVKYAVGHFRKYHNTLCLSLQILNKPLFSNALGNMQCPQEYLKTIVYAKFGGKRSVLWGIRK